MTIVQVMHSHTVGGVERHVVDLSEALVARGHRVFMACPNRGWIWDAVQATRVTPIHLAMDGLLDLTSVGRLTRLLRHVQADIVHSHMTRGTFYAVKSGRRAHVPIIATAHATHTHKHYAGADRVLCVSCATMENLIRHEVPKEKLHLVHNGIILPKRLPDAATIAALRSAWGVPPGGRVVGMLARLIPDKGIDTLIEVAARWRTERPNVRFVVAGGGDEETERELRLMAQGKGVSDTVSFLGTVDKPAEVIAAYDVLAAPSRRESFSLTLLEAMAIGTPVVSTCVGGTPEMITSGLDGILVEPDNPCTLAVALEHALEGADVPQITAAARRTVEDRFTLDRMVSSIEGHYLDLVR